MMRFCVILIGLAASAAYSHDEVTLPELPIPAIDQLFPVDDVDAAFRWADRGLLGQRDWGRNRFVSRWFVVALSESQYGAIDELLAGIQRSQVSVCEGLDGRFGVYLGGFSQGGVDNEFLWTFSRGLNNIGWTHKRSHYLLKNRFSVAGGQWAGDTELRDTGFEMRFYLTLVDNADCADRHTSHSDGSPRHDLQSHPRMMQHSPSTAWIPIGDLLDGTVAATTPTTPAEPEEPEAPAEPEDPAENNAEVERLQAELDALRGDLSELNGDLSAVRDSVAFLLGEPPAGGVDTVEVVRHDTLLFCPQTDEERRDLFDLFTGLDDDESETDGPAGKAASVKPSSWGAIKALTRRER